MFYGGMKESQPSDKSKARIEIADVSHEVFLKVLEFLYTDHVVHIPPELAVHLLMAAERFLLVRLKSLCETAIRKSVRIDNVVQTLLTAHAHNAISLKDMTLDFLLDHLDMVKATPSFALLKSEPELLMEIIMKSS
jgi:speckle-type POZ protein